MAPKSGDTVHVHYRGTLADGSEFDSSEGRDPLSFVMGAGEVIPGFDAAVGALEVGESSTVSIAAADAYGDHDPEGVQTFPLDFFGGQVPEIGWTVELETQDGQKVPAAIIGVSEESVVLDFNHPLAGKDLTFEITLVEVVES
jgi:FKBP-type peptidyl-prolyl cis-trans isomerase 2